MERRAALPFEGRRLQRLLAREAHHVDLHKDLVDVLVVLGGLGQRELPHVNAQRVIGGRCLESAQRLDSQQAHHQRRPLPAALDLELQCGAHLVGSLTKHRLQVEEALAQLALGALRRSPLEHKVDVAVLLVRRAQRFLQQLLRLASCRHLRGVAECKVERAGGTLAQRLRLEL